MATIAGAARVHKHCILFALALSGCSSDDSNGGGGTPYVPTFDAATGSGGSGAVQIPSPSGSSANAGGTGGVSGGCPTGFEVIGCSISGGGHCWFGSPDCGTGGGPIGLAFVGANSNTMVNTDAVWDFLSRFSK